MPFRNVCWGCWREHQSVASTRNQTEIADSENYDEFVTSYTRTAYLPVSVFMKHLTNAEEYIYDASSVEGEEKHQKRQYPSCANTGQSWTTVPRVLQPYFSSCSRARADTEKALGFPAMEYTFAACKHCVRQNKKPRKNIWTSRL
jgi:hypothetical protein